MSYDDWKTTVPPEEEEDARQVQNTAPSLFVTDRVELTGQMAEIGRIQERNEAILQLGERLSGFMHEGAIVAAKTFQRVDWMAENAMLVAEELKKEAPLVAAFVQEPEMKEAIRFGLGELVVQVMKTEAFAAGVRAFKRALAASEPPHIGPFKCSWCDGDVEADAAVEDPDGYLWHRACYDDPPGWEDYAGSPWPGREAMGPRTRTPEGAE